MYKKTLCLFGLLVLGSAQAAQLPEEIIEYMDGSKVVAFLDKDAVARSAGWQPLAGPPPVTIEHVATTLQTYAAARPTLANATLSEVELKPIPHHQGNWYYLAMMQTVDAAQTKNHYFVVLMNGDVIPAIEEPASVR